MEDILTQFKEFWLKLGKSEDEFDEMFLPLKEHMLSYHDISDDLMRQYISTWMEAYIRAPT